MKFAAMETDYHPEDDTLPVRVRLYCGHCNTCFFDSEEIKTGDYPHDVDQEHQ